MRPVKVVPLSPLRDRRGSLTEIFRQEWVNSALPVQWNYVQSEANVLRGIQVHVKRIDYLVMIKGRMQVGLSDLREGGIGAGSIIELSEDNRSMLVIPQGVAHGFYFPEPTIFAVGLSEYWDHIPDEHRCRWDDPGLGIPWPKAIAPLLSERDEAACSLEELLVTLRNEENVSW